jgi:thiol-disulfide isomerase/thioredoxin
MFFSARFGATDNGKSASETQALVDQLVSDYGNNEDGKKLIDQFRGSLNYKIAVAYIKEGNLPKFNFYLQNETDLLWKANLLNVAATSLSNKNIQLKEAEQMSRKSLVCLDSAIGAKLNESTAEVIREKLARYHDTDGYILYQLGRNEEALLALAKATQLLNGNDAAINGHYALALVRAGQYNQALPLLEIALKNGNTTAALGEAFRTAYIKTGHNESGYNTRLAELTTIAQTDHKLTLKKLALNELAPSFTLNDTHGKPISLTDLKGKTVVLDFWATWCGPCKESFPGMQQLMARYKGQEVVFLFINTLESNSNNLVKNINDYMTGHRFNFRVLIDEHLAEDGRKFQAASDFKVTSLPTKLVIDPTGHIRFRSTGYLGSNEALVTELSEQIEAVKNYR